MTAPVISVVIPAFNEAIYLPRYLPTVLASLAYWEHVSGQRGEVIVVDNASTDETSKVAVRHGARVVHEPARGIGRARNSGASEAAGRFLFFADADVALPVAAVDAAMQHMTAGRCGGAIPPVYRPKRFGARLLVAYWARYRDRHGGAQGVAQFCTAEAFRAVGGYRPELYMSEDVEFFSRLERFGETRGVPVVYLDELRVEPSTRRFDRWPAWRMIWWQNPVTARLFLSSRRFWRHWYDRTVR